MSNALAARIAECDPFGALHIVLEDLNVEDHHIQWCLSDENTLPLTEGDRAVGEELLLLSEDERRAVLIEADRLR